MIGKIILTILEIVLLVGAIMYLLGAWDITGFPAVDDPIGDGNSMWNWMIASVLFWLAVFLFLTGIAFGRKENAEDNYEFDGQADKEYWENDSKENKKNRKGKKFKSKGKEEDSGEEW